MSGSFFGFNTAVRGLFAAQRNLDIINHNINNVNTPGYSRQYGVQQAGTPIASSNGTGMLGTGSVVTAVNKVRDEFLDYKYWSENVQAGEWSVKSQLTFGEPSGEADSGSGFSAVINDFYNIIQELSKSPEDLAIRASVRQNAITFAKYFNSLAERFEKMQNDMNHSINTKVEEINTYAARIADINKQIYSAEIQGNTANDLRDQRTALVDSLSKLVNIQAGEKIIGELPNGEKNKQFVITISGKILVDSHRVTKLEAVQRNVKLNEVDIDKLYDIKWEDGNDVEIKGGELKGYLDIRDGNQGLSGPSGAASPSYKGLPYYMEEMNEFVRTFAKFFDEGNGTESGHMSGYGLNSTTGGTRFFTILDGGGNPVDTSTFAGDYSTMTAKNFTVSKEIMDSIEAMAASQNPGESGNSQILKNILDFRHDSHMFVEGAPEDFMKSLIVNAGIDSQQAERIYFSQKTISDQLESRRISVSGVSIDEEMANLIMYRYSYNACAKIITTMAEIYDTLINRTGV